jgi:hypothetical protein
MTLLLKMNRTPWLFFVALLRWSLLFSRLPRGVRPTKDLE